MAKKKNIADRIISGEYDKEWLQENKKNKEVIKQSREEQQSSLKLPTKENTSNIQLKNNNISNENFSTNNINLGRLQRNNSNNFFNVNDNTRRIQSIGLPMRNKQEAVRKILSTGIGIKYGENAGKIANDTIGSVQNLLSSAKTGIMQFGKTLNERLTDNMNLRINLTNSDIERLQKYGEDEKAKALLEGKANLFGLKQNKDTGKLEEIKYEEANKDIQNKIDEENKKMQETVEDSKTKVGKLTTEFTSSLGNNLVGGAVSSINPMLGATYFVGSATGSYEDDARERGMEGNGAKLYSGVMGGIEGTLDYLLGFGSLKSGFKAIGKENVGKAVAKFGETLLGNGLENAFQEGITEPIQELVATITNGKDKANWDNIGQRIFKSTIFGFASGAIFHGVGRGLGSISNIQNKINNGEMLSPTDLQNVTQELEKSGMSKEEIFETAKNNALEAVNAEVQRIKQEEQQTEVNKTNSQEQAKQEIISRMNNNQTQDVANNQERIEYLKSIDTSNMGFIERGKIKTEIRALEQGYNSIEEYQEAEKLKREQAEKEYEQRQKEKENIESQKKAQLENDIKESTPMKNAQFEIIQNTNPMLDDYHTGIRSPKDIKTFDEVINDEESFVWGDFSKEDAKKALQEGKITIYSSYPIENGVFVSTSKVQAEDYAGGRGNKVYSKDVPLQEVAWINGDEGQYAKVENNLTNNQKNIVNNSKKVYNIINKSITNNERAQVSDEVRRWRINQENGLGYIDLSEKGYNSYIYNKQGGNVETILKVNGSEEFKNYIRKGVEDGTFSNAEGFNKSIAEIKNEYRKYRSSNDSMSGRKSNNRNDKLPTRQIRREESSNTARDIKQNSGNESIENSNQSSFIMPTAENTNENNIQETEINPYRNTGRANKLIKEKNIKIEQLENQLKQTTSQEKQNNIQQEIQNIEKQYNEQIQTLYDEINNKDNKERKAPTRHEVIQKNREIARQNIENIANWKDKSRGSSYQLETMERNMYDIIPDKAEAKQVIDTYFEPVHSEEANKHRFLNKNNDRIRKLDLNKYESEAVQFLGEKKYNPDFTKGDGESLNQRNEVQRRINDNIKNRKIDIDKVNNAIEVFRDAYDELFDLENKVLKENGYKEKDYRKGYFPHFIDYTPETMSEKILNKLGFKIDKRPLPTDIAGITEQFVPGKTWNRSALQRKTNKTDYNALKGFDTYLAQAADVIFHTENIQRLRGLENEIRYQYSDKGVQKRIDDILNNDILDADEKQDMIDAILKQVENPMPNLVTELRRYTNALANKKSEADRSMEQMAGRQVYSTINAIENKFGANAVGLNIGSAVTNFIPITQAWSQIGTKNIARASIDYSKSLIEDDGFVNKSAFLTSRLNQAEKLYQTWSDKATSKANFLFDAIDDVASNIVVRGKYLENIQKGMSETEAIKNADQFARNVIADRSKGALPTKFEEKNPISKAFTQFQLEVNNQYRYMFKDIPRDLKEKGLGAIAIAYLKMFVGAWLYNKFAEKITGRKPAFSPIDLIKSSYDTIKDEKMGTYEKITKIGKDIGEQAPFIGGFLGGGRIPINGALPNIANVTKAGIGLTTGEMGSKKAKETLGKEFSKPLYYLLPPLGGGQLKKSVEGISAVNNGGSYGIDKDGKETLQFPVESKNVLNYIKAGVFGKYALPEAKTYTDSGFKSLNAKQTEAYKDIKMPYKEFIEYTNNKLEKTADKINYINNMKINDDQKWGLYKYDVLSSTLRDDGTSQKSDAEYAINNKLATKKEYMDLYNKANNNNINMPNTEELKNIKEQGISLKTFVDYKINSKGNKKQSDKIKMLLNSNYSDEEKGSLYINYINKNDNQYETMKATGIDIDEYIKYKQQNFKSDTTDNGTLKGKSERNKKNKVVKYLNSMNIKGNQRLLLYAMERYKTTPSQKNQLVKYVNSLDLKNKEKLELFNKFSGFKVYKNGKITY